MAIRGASVPFSWSVGGGGGGLHNYRAVRPTRAFYEQRENEMLSSNIRGQMLLDLCYLIKRYHEEGDLPFEKLSKDEASLYLLSFNSNLDVLRETPALTQALIDLLEHRRWLDPLVEWNKRGYMWILPWRLPQMRRGLAYDETLWTTYETLRKMVGTTKFLEIERYGSEAD